MPYNKLSPEERRSLILAAVKPGANVTNVARQFGVTRNAVYDHYNRAARDPEGQWREAQAEADFRRKVYEMLR
jgi:transposase-like protein